VSSPKRITMCCSVLPPEIIVHDAYIGGRFRRTNITRKASDAAGDLQLYRIVRFFHPGSSWTMTRILADVRRITLNASCMTISGGRTKQLDIFCSVTGFMGDFLSFIVVELIRFFHGALQLIMTLVHLIMSFHNISLFCMLLHTYLKWQGHLEFLWKCVLSYTHATTSRTLNLAWYTAGGREWGEQWGSDAPNFLDLLVCQYRLPYSDNYGTIIQLGKEEVLWEMLVYRGSTATTM